MQLSISLFNSSFPTERSLYQSASRGGNHAGARARPAFCRIAHFAFSFPDILSLLSLVSLLCAGGSAILVVKDISKLLVGIPSGAWVALSKDEERVIASSAELQGVLDAAKKAGETDPVITRVLEADSSTLLF
ncbi:MAG TPA: hypothetical protein VJW94_14100 [Candidatus Acidoferrum sp.]|nr:hypothetical protein [Candidatus Acidoferrum sp.]